VVRNSSIVAIEATLHPPSLAIVGVLFHALCLWSLQGDTLQNVASDLEKIFQTGHYSFIIPENIAEPGRVELIYKPSSKRAALVKDESPSEDQASTVPNLDDNVKEETWDSEQTGNFARKLGFLDSEKAGGELVKPFLHINEVQGIAHKKKFIVLLFVSCFILCLTDCQ